jgi:S-DNA-T family DNA segregation ATPase FtsK/SpoIIIE
MPRKPTKQSKSSINNEVWHIGIAAGGILVFLALVGMLGPVGRFLHALLFGFFGLGAVVLPVGMLAYSACRLVAREFVLPIFKIIAVFWLGLALLHILMFDPYGSDSDFIFAQVFYSCRNYSGGGFFGLVIGGLLDALLGEIGALVLIISAMIMLVVLMTKRSFVQMIGRGVDKARDY